MAQTNQDYVVIDWIRQPLRIGETGKAEMVLRKRRLIDFSDTFQSQ